MAEQQGGETLRQMLAGFNAMQQSLGLLPVQSGAMPMGVSIAQPPPPPPIMHPSEFAIQAHQQQMMAMQQTLQAAQMTRYMPPPSQSPLTWGRTMDQLAGQQFNPYIANALGGGMSGMPSPAFMTAPQFGMYRPMAGAMGPLLGAQRVPSVFNPFAPQLPAPNFMTPAMQNLQIMQGYQGHAASTLAAVAEGGLGLGGSLLGTALGGMLGGPLGGFAGGFIGNKLGGLVSDMTIGPAISDLRRGRMIQNMTAPFMVSGSSLNPFTGQGMERQAARDTAFGLRHLLRDQDFRHTGFNQADIDRITQLSADQGLLATARNPEDIARKVKDISKSVKALMQITGDPDVRSAIQHLGQMRNLGFEGIAGQAGAVANRALFARMAGVSQAALNDQFAMPGAMMAQGIGLAGATGYHLGGVAGAMSNIAISSGSFTDLQLARGGGRQGVAQTNLMASLGAANQDIFMAAALKRNARGELDIDIDAYRRAQRMPISEVAQEAGRRMNAIGAQGIFELSTRKQEFKDRLQQQMSPFEGQLNIARQAMSMQHTVGHGMTFGAALRTMIGSSAAGMGMSDEEREQAARTLELQFTNRGYYEGVEQQLRAQRRQAADRARARREMNRTHGLLHNMGVGIGNGLGAVGDVISGGFGDVLERSDRIEEDRALQGRGESMLRFNESALIRNARDRRLAQMALGDRAIMGGFGGTGDPFADSGRNMNRLGNLLTLSSYSGANRLVELGNQSTGQLFGMGTTFGSIDVARQRMSGVRGAAGFVRAGRTMSGGAAAGRSVAGKDLMSIVISAAQHLRSELPKARLGGAITAGAATEEAFKKSFIAALNQAGVTGAAAERAWEENKDIAGAQMAEEVRASGDQKAIETLDKAEELSGRLGGIAGLRDRAGLDAQVERSFNALGIRNKLFGTDTGSGEYFRDKNFEQIKQVVKNTDSKVLAMAAALSAGNTGELERIRRQVGDEKYSALRSAASAFRSSQSSVVQQALKTMGAGHGNLEQRFSEAKIGIGGQMASQAFITTASHLGEQLGIEGLGGANNVTDLLDRIASSGANLGGVTNSRQRAAIERYKNAKSPAEKKAAAAAFSEAMLDSGAKGTKEIVGGAGSAEERSIDQQIEDVEKLKKQLGGDSAMDKTQELFASSVEVLAQAAKDLKEVTEELRLQNAGDPRMR